MILVLIWLATAASAQEQGPFERIKLEFPGFIQDHLLRDLDGDGRLDILVVHGAPGDNEDHRLGICLQRAEAAFDPCTIFDLPEEARALDAGPLDGNVGAELVVLTTEGARVTSFVDGRFGALRTLTDRPNLFAGSEPGVPRPLDLLFDLDGDGREELLLPSLEGPVWVREGGPPHTFASPASVGYQLTARAGDINGFLRDDFQARITTRQQTPDLFVEDFDGDGRLDVITLRDNVISVFPQAADGSFPATPSRSLERSSLEDEEAATEFTGEAATFSQLDGDGHADLVLMKWGSSEERTRMDRSIYFSRADGSLPEVPDQQVRSESVFPDFDIRDLNGDGRRDLVVPFFHFAPAQAVRVVTQNSIKLQFRIFLMGENGRYAQGEGKAFAKVDRRVALDYHLDILKLVFGNQARPTGRIAPLLDFGADFNGDGYADLAADDGSDRLRIYWGNAEADYASSPDLVVPFESTLSYDLVDADGNGKTDVIAYHGTRPVREEIQEGFHAVKKRRTEAQRARRAAARRAREASDEAAPEERVRLEILLSR